VPKSLRESLAEKDWSNPTSDLIYTVFLLAKDAIEIVSLMAIALAVKLLLGLMKVPSLEIAGYEIQAAQIVKNFDYMLLLVFLCVQAWKLFRSMMKK
jgi:hypothetical protein